MKKEKTIEFINKYNHEKRLKSLNYKTPKRFLKEKWDQIKSYNVSLYNSLIL